MGETVIIRRRPDPEHQSEKLAAEIPTSQGIKKPTKINLKIAREFLAQIRNDETVLKLGWIDLSKLIMLGQEFQHPTAVKIVKRFVCVNWTRIERK